MFLLRTSHHNVWGALWEHSCNPGGKNMKTASSAQHSQTEDPWVPKHKSFPKWKNMNLGVNKNDTRKCFHCPLVRSERPNTRTSGVRNCVLCAWHHLKYSSGGFNAIGEEATVRRAVELTNLNNVIEKECALSSFLWNILPAFQVCLQSLDEKHSYIPVNITPEISKTVNSLFNTRIY